MDIEHPEHLGKYLEENGYLLQQDILSSEVLRGGVSNRTVLLRRSNGNDWVIKQALPRLRVQDEWFSEPARIHHEAEGIRILEGLTPAGTIVPLVFEDNVNHIVAMEAVESPHSNWKTELLLGRLDEKIVQQFAQCLALIHVNFDETAYPKDGVLRDRRFFHALRLEAYYRRTAERVEDVRPFFRDLERETLSRQWTFVHGDFSPKNVLIHEGTIVLLDHEVAHIGDPAFDIGFAMTHFLSKANHISEYREAFRQLAHRFWIVYEKGVKGAEWAGPVEQAAVRHTLGCLLARVAGRSPLEYLSEEERSRQLQRALFLVHSTPSTIPALIDAFILEL